MLENIKLLTKNNDDNLINLLIKKTKIEIERYCKTEYIEKMDNLLEDMVCHKLNTLNTSGFTSQSYNGISESYTTDYPPNILRRLDSFKKRVRFY